MTVLRFYYFVVVFIILTSVLCNIINAHLISKRESIVFPETVDEKPIFAEKAEIPIDVMMRLSQVTNISDFIENFIDIGNMSGKTSATEPFEILSRSGEGILERNAILTPVQATCIPELTTVPLAVDKKTSNIYFPQCVRVKRCGGCCGVDLLSCQPEETQILNYAVFTAEYSGRGKFSNLKKEIIQVEEHTKCKCSCKIKKEDCSRYQIYNPKSCSCECDNNDEREKCLKQDETKLWNPDTCTCMCRELQECGSGRYFSPYTCSCRKAPKHSNIRWVLD